MGDPFVRAAGFVVALAVGGVVAIGPAWADSTPSSEQAVQMLNEWRARIGVQPVAHDPVQSDGCRQHANYYGLNPDTSGHFEDPSRPGYTPEGDAAAASSVLSYGSSSDEGPYAWEGAVYHRTSILNPRLTTTGYWGEHDLACMGVFGDRSRREPQLTIHPYPHDGQQGVGTTFSCNETPNPCESVPGNDGNQPTGFIPSVQFNGPWNWIDGPHVSAASLTPDGGGPVGITVEDALSPRAASLDHGLDIIPHAELRPGTWYTAAVHGELAVDQPFEPSAARVPFSVTWRFQTELVNPESYLSFGQPRAGERCRMTGRCGRAYLRPWLKLQSLSPAFGSAGAVRTVTGQREAVVSLRPGEEVPVALKPGRYDICVQQPAAGAFDAFSGCVRANVVGYPTVALRPRGRRNGRRLRIVVIPDPVLVGRRASVTYHRTTRVCPRARRCSHRRSGRRHRKTVRLRSRTVMSIATPTRGSAMNVSVAVKAFGLGDTRYVPLTAGRRYR